jgi:hypothetical protein
MKNPSKDLVMKQLPGLEPQGDNDSDSEEDDEEIDSETEGML